MKNSKKFGCFAIVVILILILTRCSSCGQSNSKQHENGIYDVQITKTSSEDGDFILKGKTDAPNGSKILAQGNADKSENEAEAVDDVGYAKVKNHKFSVRLDASYLSDKDIEEGQKIKVRIFAIKKYSAKFEDYKITKKVQKIIAKEIDPITLTVNEKIANYYADDDDEDSDDSDDADNDEDDKSDSQSEDKDDSESDTDDEDTEKSDESSKNDESQTATNTSSKTTNNGEKSTDNNSRQTQAGKVYTGNSEKIIGDVKSHRYHVPGQAGYYINSENVVYFNSEQEAQAQGFIKAKR